MVLHDLMGFFFYFAQAIYIYNRYEINKDLGVFCDEQDLEKIY